MTIRITSATALLALCLGALIGCSNGNNNNSPAPAAAPPPPAEITLAGSAVDGAVAGGTLFVFTSATILAALEAADGVEDPGAALAGASPAATLERDAMDEEAFELDIDGELAGQVLFLLLDTTDAEDLEFGDRPFTLGAAVVAGDAGSTQVVNLTPHTTLAALLVLAEVDPDGDGTPADDATLAAAIDAAMANVLALFGTDEIGDPLFPGGEDPTTTEDAELLSDASGHIGLRVRAAAAVLGESLDDVLFALAADAADGALDGMAPAALELDLEEEALVSDVYDLESLGEPVAGDMHVVSCAASARAMRRACGFDVLDDLFVGLGRCADTSSQADSDACQADVEDESDETLQECADVFAARLELCDALDDAPHEPEFGAAFAGNFVDPLTIGGAVEANPYFPLVQGNRWVYEGTFIDEDSGEEVTEVITVTVTAATKLIEGITCLVVNDVVEEDGEVIEDTDDWYAQDVDGNVWYCGEIAENFESFDGDEPAEPELVDIEGSWKAGRDGAKPGMLLPRAPVEGAVIRQEVSLGDAEDVIEILSLTGTESVVAASCDGDCLVTRDFTPLEPDAEEHKYYAPGLGMILELDPESGDRVELIDFEG